MVRFSKVIVSIIGVLYKLIMSECEYKLNLVFEKPDEKLYKCFPILKTSFRKIIDNSHLVKRVIQQSPHGSCVSCSISTAIHDKGVEEPSILFIYYNARDEKHKNDDRGTSILKGLQSLSEYGVCETELHPYLTINFNKQPSNEAYKEALKVKGIQYSAIQQNKLIIKNELFKGKFVIFGAKIFKSFYNYDKKTGMIPLPDRDKEKVLGGHALTIIGSNSYLKAFKILNSWGRKFGLDGFAYMPYEYVLDENLCSDFFIIL